MYPSLQPVLIKIFDIPLMAITGTSFDRLAVGLATLPSNVINPYISSDIIGRSFSPAMSMIFLSDFSLYIAPVGLFGLTITIAFVFSFIFFLSSSVFGSHSSSSKLGDVTAFA